VCFICIIVVPYLCRSASVVTCWLETFFALEITAERAVFHLFTRSFCILNPSAVTTKFLPCRYVLQNIPNPAVFVLLYVMYIVFRCRVAINDQIRYYDSASMGWNGCMLESKLLII